MFLIHSQQKAKTEIIYLLNLNFSHIQYLNKYPVNIQLARICKRVLHSHHAQFNRWAVDLGGSKAHIGCSDARAPTEIPTRIAWKVHGSRAPVKTNQFLEVLSMFTMLFIEHFMRVNSLPKKSTLLVRSWVVMLGLVGWCKQLLWRFRQQLMWKQALLPKLSLFIAITAMSLCMKPMIIIHMQ